MVFAKPIALIFVILAGLLSLKSAAHAAPVRSWGVGVMSWPETVKITDNTGRGFDSTAQFYTPSIHLGSRENRKTDGFLYEFYGFFGKADIQSEGGLTYFQKRVSVYGVGGAVGWYFRPEGKQVNFGFSAPLQVRSADWTQPPTGGSVAGKQAVTVGAVIDARWRLTQDLAINQRIGGFFGHKSALWMLNLEWTL